MAGKLFVISGPSGAGKGTLVSNLMSRRDGLWLSVSATTRMPRKGEQEGVSYFFLTDEQFDDLIENDGFIEWAHVHTNRYGTLRSVVEDKIASGTDVVLEIDAQGARQIRERYPDAVLIFIKAPDMQVLEKRLRDRGTETEEQIQVRLQTAKVEMQQEKYYNYSLVNDDLERATEELLGIVDAERGK